MESIGIIGIIQSQSPTGGVTIEVGTIGAFGFYQPSNLHVDGVSAFSFYQAANLHTDGISAFAFYEPIPPQPVNVGAIDSFTFYRDPSRTRVGAIAIYTFYRDP